MNLNEFRNESNFLKIPVALFAIILFASGSKLTIAEDAPRPPSKELRELLNQLRDEDPMLREKSRKTLIQIGARSIPHLQKAYRKSTELDFQNQIATILQSLFKKGELPANFTENRYSIRHLTQHSQDHAAPAFAQTNIGNPINPFADSFTRHRRRGGLLPKDALDLLKRCIPAEHWQETPISPVAMHITNNYLHFVQTKIGRKEISNSLRWLRKAVSPSLKATIVMLKINSEKLNLLIQNGSISENDFTSFVLKNNLPSRLIQVEALEGQYVTGGSGSRHAYLSDYDISGAVYDPVTRNVDTGLHVAFRALNLLKEQRYRMDLHFEWSPSIIFDRAHITSDSVAKIAPKDPDRKKDKEKLKPETGELKTHSPPTNSRLPLQLPNRILGGFSNSLVTKANQFTFAGSLDLSPVETPNTPLRHAIFVKLDPIEIESLSQPIPKSDNISFHSYPLSLFEIPLMHFPLRQDVGDVINWRGENSYQEHSGDVIVKISKERTCHIVESPWRRIQALLPRNSKAQFSRAVGAVGVVRTKDKIHQRILAILHKASPKYTPIEIHTQLISMPSQMALACSMDKSAYTENELQQLISKDSKTRCYTDSRLTTLMGQITHTFAGRQRARISDYEISGDTWDPVIRIALTTGYHFEYLPTTSSSASKIDLQVKLTAMPRPLQMKRIHLKSHHILQGATTSLLETLKAPLDNSNVALMHFNQNTSIPLGKYVMAGTAPEPRSSDKVQPTDRQLVLFIGIHKR